jgi:hypothetical protein
MNGGGGAVSGELVARDVVCQKKSWLKLIYVVDLYLQTLKEHY